MNSFYEAVSPESVGIPSAAILEFIDEAEKRGIQLHSLMILRHGKAAASFWWKPYAPEIPHHLYSFSKSIASTAVGFALSEGLLRLDDRITKFFPHRVNKNADPRIYSVTVEQLLTMTSGNTLANEASLLSQVDWVGWFLNTALSSFPGDKFNYNSLNTYMLSAILRQVTGMSLVDYLYPRLFEPLCIERPYWATCPMGIECGGWGLSLTTEDMAKFCQLYLNDGMLGGKRILPEGWAATAGAFHVPTACDDKFQSNPNSVQGYGYQFWRNRDGSSYRADGMMGQYGLIIPEKDAVIVTTAGHIMQLELLDVIMDKLVPYIGYIPEQSPTGIQFDLLRERAEVLALAQPVSVGRPRELEQRVSGLHYTFPVNVYSMLPLVVRYLYDITPLGIEEMQLIFGDEQCVLRCLEDGKWQESAFVPDGKTYTRGELVYGGECFETSVCAAWVDETHLEVDIRVIRTPHMLRFTIGFTDKGVVCTFNEDPSLEFSTRYMLDMIRVFRPMSNRLSKAVGKLLPELVGTIKVYG